MLVCATYICVLFFARIPFVVNHTFNATPTEWLKQSSFVSGCHVWLEGPTVLIKSRLVALHVIVRLLLSLNPRSHPALLGDRISTATSRLLHLLCFFRQLPSIEQNQDESLGCWHEKSYINFFLRLRQIEDFMHAVVASKQPYDLTSFCTSLGELQPR